MASTPPWVFDAREQQDLCGTPLSADYHENSNGSTEIRSYLMQNPYMREAILPRSESSSPYFFQRSPSRSGEFPHGEDPLDQINPSLKIDSDVFRSFQRDLYRGAESAVVVNRSTFENNEAIPVPFEGPVTGYSQPSSSAVFMPVVQQSRGKNLQRLKEERRSCSHGKDLRRISRGKDLRKLTRGKAIQPSSIPSPGSPKKKKQNTAAARVKEESVCTQWSPQAGIASPKVDFNKDIPSVSSQPSPSRKRRVPEECGEEERERFYEIISGPQPKKEKLMSLEDFEVMKNDVKSNGRLKKSKRSKALTALSDRFQRQKKTQSFKKMGNVGDLLVNILKRNPAAWQIPELREVIEEVRPYFRKHYGRNMDIPVLAGIQTDPVADDD